MRTLIVSVCQSALSHEEQGGTGRCRLFFSAHFEADARGHQVERTHREFSIHTTTPGRSHTLTARQMLSEGLATPSLHPDGVLLLCRYIAKM